MKAIVVGVIVALMSLFSSATEAKQTQELDPTPKVIVENIEVENIETEYIELERGEMDPIIITYEDSTVYWG